MNQTYTQLRMDRGHAIARFYVSAFLRWKVYGEADERQWFVGPAAFDAGASAFPDEVRTLGTVDLWEDLYEQERFAVLGQRPVMLAAFSQGIAESGVHRLRIDTMSRPNDLLCTDPGQDEIFSPSEPAGANLTSNGLENTCLSQAIDQSIGYHETNAMDLPWGEANPGDEVRWQLGGPIVGRDGLLAYDTLSLRLGKRSAGAGVTSDPLEVDFVLETEALDDQGSMLEATVPYDRIIAQAFSGQSPVTVAAALHTVRVPLTEFATSGTADLARPRSLALRVPSTGPSSTDTTSRVHVDSIEFTRHPSDASTMETGLDAFWRCEATTTLIASETACDTVPRDAECPTGHTTTVSMPLPQASDGSGTYNGWVVATHPGWIEDPDDPTSGDLDRLTQRCITACQREFIGQAHVSANCDASGAFNTPSRYEDAAMVTRRAIPDQSRDGSGIEPGQALSCDLLDDCCLEFGENVCPAAGMRVTDALGQLGRGEQWVAVTGGKVFVLSLDEQTMFDASVAGTLGWSTCADGNAASPCPFYLGSGHLEITEPLVVDLDCNGQVVQKQLDVLELDLVQPAFGIDFEDDEWKGMPAGSMVVATHVEVGAFAYDTVEPSREPVVLETDGGFIKFHPSGGPKVFFDIWCEGERKPMEAVFSVNSAWNPSGPPSVAIDMPGNVTCGAMVDLEADASDPQSDHGPVRWEIDGVLLDGSVEQIQVNTTHEIRAIVRDARGATAADTHTITCTT